MPSRIACSRQAYSGKATRVQEEGALLCASGAPCLASRSSPAQLVGLVISSVGNEMHCGPAACKRRGIPAANKVRATDRDKMDPFRRCCCTPSRSRRIAAGAVLVYRMLQTRKGSSSTRPDSSYVDHRRAVPEDADVCSASVVVEAFIVLKPGHTPRHLDGVNTRVSLRTTSAAGCSWRPRGGYARRATCFCLIGRASRRRPCRKIQPYAGSLGASRHSRCARAQRSVTINVRLANSTTLLVPSPLTTTDSEMMRRRHPILAL